MTTGKRKKALALLSSGIDSALAIRLMLDQGIDVSAVNFVLPFSSEKKDYAGSLAEQLGVPLVKFEAMDDYIEVVRSPKYGYGYNMNPCIDCRIYMLRQAKRVAQEEGADFIVTGDVLGERPMSQNEAALNVEERDAGLKGLILRPLSAKLLPETVPERRGWVDRSRLLAIKGRSRKPQLTLACQFGITGYRSPSGGCLLTSKEFSAKLRNLFGYKKHVTRQDIELLRLGRHIYLPSSEIIVGRNERENKVLLNLKSPEDYVLEVSRWPGPITLVKGAGDKRDLELAARLTAEYSDAPCGQVAVRCRKNGINNQVVLSLQRALTRAHSENLTKF